MQAIRIFVLLACVVFSAPAQQITNSQPISLQSAIERALEHNLDLQIERYNPLIARSDLSAAYGGYDPFVTASGAHSFSLAGGGIDPSTKLPLPSSTSDQNNFSSSLSGLLPGGLNYSLQGNIGEQYGSAAGFPYNNTRGAALVNLRQPLLKNFWIDATRLNIRVRKTQLKQSELRLRKSIMDVVTAVELAYYDLIFTRESVKVQEKALELAVRLAQENKKRVEVGTLAPLDEKQAEAQAAGSRADLLQAQRALAASENAFKRLLTDRFSELQPVELLPSDPLLAQVQVFNLQDSWNRGLTQRPDLLQAKLDLEKQGVILKYNRNQLFPELDLTGTYGHSTGGAEIREFNQGFDEIRMGNKPFYSYGAQISFPLGNTSARSNYRISRMQLDQLVLGVKKLEQDILVVIDDAIKLAKASYERIQATREQREAAEAALDAEQKKLESGKSTNFEVLRLQRDLTSARSEEINALVQYNRNLAQLSLFEASTLERNKIDINAK